MNGIRLPDFRRRACALLAPVVVAALAVLSPAPAAAQGALDRLPAEARARLADRAELARALGAAGTRPVRVIVEFADPPAPPAAGRAAGTADQRRAAAVRAVQDRILARALGPREARGAADAGLRRLRLSPLLALEADAGLIARLAADPEVVRVHLDRAEAPMLADTLPLIGIDAARSDFGATGAGQVVAVIDTGVQTAHGFLAANLVGGACFSSNSPAAGATSLCPGGVTSATTLASAEDCAEGVARGCGHGTHVAGIAAGRNAAAIPGAPDFGTAGDAGILAINAFSLFAPEQCGGTACVLSFVSDQIAALEHVYGLRHGLTIAAVNMSLGGGLFAEACADDQRAGIIRRLREAGIATVVSAGNNGSGSQINAPACVPGAIAVGNTDNSDRRNISSNWGPLVHLAAPGTSVRSAFAVEGGTDWFGRKTGTSMAAPHVAGALALLRQVQPEASVDLMVEVLRATGVSVASAGVAVPRIQVDAALRRLSAAQATATTLNAPSTAPENAPVRLEVQVRSASGAPAAGRVRFFRDGVEFADAMLDAAGAAAVELAGVPAGTYAIEARFMGAAGTGAADAFRSSASAPRSLTLTPARETTTTLTGPALTEIDRPTVYVARVRAGATVPTAGAVEFFLNGRLLEASGLSAAGEARLTYQSAVAETVRLTAVYSGAPGLRASSSSPLTVEVVEPAPTSTTLTGPALTEPGRPVTLVARVRSEAGAPAGRIQFRRNGTAFATVDLTAAGEARLTVDDLPAGEQRITAHYLRVVGFAGSASGPLTVRVVEPAPTTTTLTGPDRVVQGDPATFVAQVTSSGSTPAGQIQFRRNGTTFATVDLDAEGRARVTVRNLPPGAQQITARYLRRLGHQASASAPLVTLVAVREADAWRGGGALFNATAQCPAAWRRSVPATVRYTPSELNGGGASVVTLAWRGGAEAVSVGGPFAPGTAYAAAVGRSLWGGYALWASRPRLRAVARQITAPAGAAGLDDGREMVLRLILRNFGNVPGCTVTVSATLRRI